MTDPESSTYEGTSWWRLQNWSGKKMKFGGEPRLAAFLYFNCEVGEIFTMRELRAALGDEAPEDAEHLNKRLRELRKDGWIFASYKERTGLAQDEYVLLAKGLRRWLGEKNPRSAISDAVRRQVLERDMSRCAICNVGRGEPYPGEPGTSARMTIGHRTANARQGDASVDNLQTECARCNEPVGDSPPNPESLAEVMSAIRQLGRADKGTLLAWIESGYRRRNKVDMAFDRVRRLSQSEHAQSLIGYARLPSEVAHGATRPKVSIRRAAGAQRRSWLTARRLRLCSL